MSRTRTGEERRLTGRAGLRPGLGTADAIDGPVLACLVGDVDAFAQSAWGQASLLARGVHGLAGVLNIQGVLALVADGGMRLPDVRMMQDGEPIPVERFTRPAQLGRSVIDGLVDADGVADLVAGGATLILQGMRRYYAPLDAVCRRLDTELGQITQAGAFLTPSRSVGAPNHYDYFDAFICQIEGRKHWAYGAPPASVPAAAWQHGQRPVDEDVVWVELSPGDCLYLPRGTYHQAKTSAEPSLHVTIRVVQPYTYRTLLEAALDYLFDRDIDLALPVAHQLLTAHDLADDMLKTLFERPSEELLHRLIDALDRARAAVAADFGRETERFGAGLERLQRSVRAGKGSLPS
jgi:bifunctional lysine-specific demethylase and histidyl-hydroxylase NO66